MEESKIVIVKEDGTEDKKAMTKQKLKNMAHTALDKAGKAAKSAWTFVVDNKENITYVATGLVAAATAINKLKPTRYDDHREYVDTSVYDYVSHSRFWLKRPMLNSETIE
jgi:hypothetical protein